MCTNYSEIILTFQVIIDENIVIRVYIVLILCTRNP